MREAQRLADGLDGALGTTLGQASRLPGHNGEMRGGDSDVGSSVVDEKGFLLVDARVELGMLGAAFTLMFGIFFPVPRRNGGGGLWRRAESNRGPTEFPTKTLRVYPLFGGYRERQRFFRRCFSDDRFCPPPGLYFSCSESAQARNLIPVA
jgi:hypothetical protein